MTKTYHPVTKEELERIVSGCAFPQNSCEECKNYTPYGCTTNGVLSLMDGVLSRPDPLALLEAWITFRYYERLSRGNVRFDAYGDLVRLIKQLRTNPAAVRDQGVKDGWWK